MTIKTIKSVSLCVRVTELSEDFLNAENIIILKNGSYVLNAVDVGNKSNDKHIRICGSGGIMSPLRAFFLIW